MAKVTKAVEDAAKAILAEKAEGIVARFQRRNRIDANDALILLGCLAHGVKVEAPAPPKVEQPAEEPPAEPEAPADAGESAPDGAEE